MASVICGGSGSSVVPSGLLCVSELGDGSCDSGSCGYSLHPSLGRCVLEYSLILHSFERLKFPL